MVSLAYVRILTPWSSLGMAPPVQPSIVPPVPPPLRPSRISVENFGRIKTGMRRGEVEAILGPPGYHVTPGRRWIPTPFDCDVDTSPVMWASDLATVVVHFTNREPDGKVVRMHCYIDANP
jgi:hypothetical protein